MQRIRIGITGLAVVFLVVLLAAAVVGLSVSLRRFYKNRGRKQYEQKIHDQS